MSVAPYIGIPTREAQLSSWAQNFSDVINASPSAYGLSLTDAANIKTANDNFQAAFVASSTPDTRTQVAVQAKNDFKNAMLATVRAYYVIIQNDPGVTDDNKLAAGIKVKSQAKTPRRAPESQPIIVLAAATPFQHMVRFADIMTPDKRHRPAGATSLQIWAFIGDSAPSDPLAGRYIGNFTRQPVPINYSPADVGKKSWVFGRWQGIRGDFGPWSTAVSMHVVGM
jgi:hypothetical protein